MIASSLLLALQLIGPSVEPGAPLEEGNWVPVDGVLAVAGDRVVTRGVWSESVLRARAATPPTTVDELHRIEYDVMEEQIIMLLTAQAGQELDVPAAAVENQVRFQRESRSNSFGVVGYRDQLDQQGIDPIELARWTRDGVYQSQWEAYTTGSLEYAGGRPQVDSFTRPGQLRAIYSLEKENMARPATVTLQILEIVAMATGGQANAEALGAQVLAALADGAPFSEQVEMYGRAHRDTDGLVEGLLLDDLAADLKTFATDSEIGELSAVLPLMDPETGLVGVQVVRLLAREGGEAAPPFRTPALQAYLRRTLSGQRRDRQLGIGRLEVARRAYRWTHPGIRPPGQAGAGR